jgi:tetratricopeptide (TPR) repeat protein
MDPVAKNYSHHFVALVLIIAIGLVVYGNSLRGGFLWDDRFLIEDNTLITSWGNLGTMFMNPVAPGFHTFYRPLINVSFLCDYSLWKLNPFGYHLTNVLIHLGCACLVYLLASLLSGDRRIALASGVLFVVHALTTEPVNYISARGDLLAAFFFLASFACYVRFRTAGNRTTYHYVLALAGFVLGLASKELVAILPVMLLGYELVLGAAKNGRKKFRYLIPFFLILLLYGVMRITLLRFPDVRLFIPPNTIASIPFIRRFATGVATLPTIAKLFVLPLGLHKSWYVAPLGSFLEPRLLLALFLLFIVIIAAKRIYRISRVSFFGILWFFILYSPHLNIYPLNAFINEGWLYLPLAGLVMSSASLAVWFFSTRKISVKIMAVVLALATSYYAVMTFNRNNIWAGDPALFYENALRHNPYEDRLYNVLGNVYYDRGEFDMALLKYEKSLQLNPKNPTTYYNIGTAHYKQNKLAEAVASFNAALACSPEYTEVYNNLGLAYHKQGRLTEAESVYKKAIELSPEYMESQYNLGNIYLQMGRFNEAITQYQRAIALNPHFARAYNHLGNAYSRIQRLDEAIVQFKKAIAIEPTYVQAYNDLGSAYFEQQNYGVAIEAYEQALAINPNYPETRFNLGIMYLKMERYDEARRNLVAARSLFVQQKNAAMAQQAESNCSTACSKRIHHENEYNQGAAEIY